MRGFIAIAEMQGLNPDISHPDQWTIRDAVVQFCSRERISDVKRCECFFRPKQLSEMGMPNLGGAAPDRGLAAHHRPGEISRLERELRAAWKSLLLDLCTRLEAGELTLSGVQTQPEFEERRTRISGQWAVELRVDPLNNAVWLAERKFVSVLVGIATGSAETEAGLGPSKALSSEQPDPAMLDDETILALLEEHARRVIASPAAKLIAPGKISLMPIIKGKMAHRAGAGDLFPVLKEECAWLAEWIAQKVTLHQVPTALAIERTLRGEYRALKRASKAGIQKQGS